MPIKPYFPIRVFYDGSCSVCAAEIEHYLRQDHGGRLRALDISDPGFDPQSYGITRDEFMYELHVIDQRGVSYRGVEAFWAIWQAFPSAAVYRALGAIISLPLINPVARLVYRGFARIRPWLPKRHDCSSGYCRMDRKQ